MTKQDKKVNLIKQKLRALFQNAATMTLPNNGFVNSLHDVVYNILESKPSLRRDNEIQAELIGLLKRAYRTCIKSAAIDILHDSIHFNQAQLAAVLQDMEVILRDKSQSTELRISAVSFLSSRGCENGLMRSKTLSLFGEQLQDQNDPVRLSCLEEMDNIWDGSSECALQISDILAKAAIVEERNCTDKLTEIMKAIADFQKNLFEDLICELDTKKVPQQRTPTNP